MGNTVEEKGGELPQSFIRSGKRLDFLDAGRGIAAIAVVLQHSLEKCAPNFLGWSLHHFSLGMFGVVVFFLVSGFIIPVSLERANSLRIFWAHRVLRLYPMYWFSLFATLTLAEYGLFPVPPTKTFLVNFTLLQSFFHVKDVLGVYWTLSLELVFYGLCSILFVTGDLRSSIRWSLLASGGLALLTLAGGEFHQSLPAGRLGLIVTSFVGTAVSRYYSREVDRQSVAITLACAALSLSVAFWFRFRLFPVMSEADAYSLASVLLSWLFAYGFFWLFFSLRAQRFPAWLVYLGRISYSLYLIHGLVVYCFPISAAWIFVPVVTVVSIVIASATYYTIERPAMKSVRSLAINVRGKRLSNPSIPS